MECKPGPNSAHSCSNTSRIYFVIGDDILSNITLNTLTLTFLIECGFSFKTGVVAFHLSELTWTIKWIPEKAATHDRIQ
jgi:hypothetical protein